MAKVTFEYDSYEEANEIQDVLNATKWKAALHELDQHLRSIYKHGAPVTTEMQIDKDQLEFAESLQQEFAASIRETLREIISGYNLNLE
jgi:hypothetical protein